MLLERGYTLSEAYALWRQRADAGVVTELAGHLEGDDSDGAELVTSDASDED